jgi:thiosulfate dehydrogenase [quinone] large subunit
MSLIFSSVLLAAFGLSLILITLSLRLLRGANPAGDSYPPGARFFLICLRLAIGWHCFVEGMEKFNAASWSSEAYLRESTGPLSGLYRPIAGDRLIEKLTLGADDAFPDQFDREWRGYLAAFSAYYDLTDEQVQRAQVVLDQRKADLKTEFAKPEEVVKISPFPPPVTAQMTMKQRLEYHERLLEKVNDAEARFPTEDKEVHAAWKRAKADLAKWRGDLKPSLDAETVKLKKKLYETLTSEQRERPLMPDPARLPIGSWRLLEWSDAAVMWSLLVLGACLMLGIFSRASSLATALLVLSFYLAMPPLPGWPEGPRLEGHYLLINKTLIEVIALLALTFIPTGRWAGLDGLLQFVLPSCCGGGTTMKS